MNPDAKAPRMEPRVILAIVLMLFVAVLPGVLFPPKPAVQRTGGPAVNDTGLRPSGAVPGPAAELPSARPPDRLTAAIAAVAETVWVTSPEYRFGFSTLGAGLVQAQLLEYKSFAPGDSGRLVQLVPDGRPLLGTWLVLSGDTVSLAGWSFTPSAPAVRVTGDSAILSLTAERGAARVVLRYVFYANDYRFAVRGRITGLGPAGAVLIVSLGDGLRSVEADTAEDQRHYAVVTKASNTRSISFGSVKPGEVKVLEGPFEWAGMKSKYFLVAALAVEENQPRFGGSVVVGGARNNGPAARAELRITLPVPPAGDFRYQLYAGPLEHRRLARLGHDLDDANPYGGFLRTVIHPVSILVVNVLLWMHERLHLAYGWVLVIFGILVRVVLWPLNQKAMEASIRMQAVAPLIKETQERYKSDPEKLQREMLRIYKEHRVNPVGGCLPMLLPMPVLFALFFVFANTIELRGEPFLWLPDLSRHDPYYIIPLLMGLSMFVLSKVGQIGVPPSPQAKMLTYMMPLVMMVVLFRFASGLNLYYTVQNVFSIPQQYLIARRRLREQGRPPS
jgi:YidC/Oxa1 family membrane protein insertase